MTAISTLLIIEDNPGDVRLLCEMLRESLAHQPTFTHVATMSEAEKHLGEHVADIIILDLGLPDAQGVDAIRRIRIVAPSIPLVVLTGLDDEELASLSLREGAQDYLVKGQIESRGLLRALRYAAERFRLERLKSEFVATVSHELRTPMTSIVASLGLLVGTTEGLVPGPVANLIRIAHTNSLRLVRLVNDILDVEKLESGRVVFDLRRIEVRSIIDQAVEANRDFAASHGVRLAVEGATSAMADVRADSDRLIQAITNLLSNAIKFSPPDTEVLLTVETGDDAVRIMIRDHGAGISAEFKSRIFERFAQADASNRRAKGGTGLGLNIVQQIMGRLGGKVGFYDAPGEGTIFYIELPCWEGRTDLAYVERIEAEELEKSTSSLQELLDTARERQSHARASA